MCLCGPALAAPSTAREIRLSESINSELGPAREPSPPRKKKITVFWNVNPYNFVDTFFRKLTTCRLLSLSGMNLILHLFYV
jgi:hypothetical protein